MSIIVFYNFVYTYLELNMIKHLISVTANSTKKSIMTLPMVQENMFELRIL